MRLTALAGGVGAAKLLSGIVRVSPPEKLTVIVNTGDDFQCMGLHISPDLDTVTYTLAGIENPATGWGIRDDSFHCLERLRELGADTWFQLGDRDLATHIFRTHRLQAGERLSEIVSAAARANGIQTRILPMTDSFVPTLVHTDEGTLEFQDYFVRRKCAPVVRGFDFKDIQAAMPASGVLESIRQAKAVIVCPSNPFISIGPILNVPGVREALQTTRARILAVSPIVAGEALKGPAANMMRQLGLEVSAFGVASLYRDFLDVFVIDSADGDLRAPIEALGIQVHTVNTIMDSTASRIALAEPVLDLLS